MAGGAGKSGFHGGAVARGHPARARKHFWITTSGNFSNPALLCCVMEMGVDRILYSVDWPFVDNMLGAEWIPPSPRLAGYR